MGRLYMDLSTGASQDMLCAGLYGLVENKYDVLHELNVNTPKNIHITIDSAISYENKGYNFKVINDNYLLDMEANKDHGYSLNFVTEIINETTFSEDVKEQAKKVYNLLGEAECAVHNVDFTKLHFHEVGSKRAIYSILSFVYILSQINPSEIICSPVNVGYGTTMCAHGEVQVPAPATRKMMKRIKTFSNDIKGELLTPTACSLLETYVDEFKKLDDFKYDISSIGIGTKDLGKASGAKMFLKN